MVFVACSYSRSVSLALVDLRRLGKATRKALPVGTPAEIRFQDETRLGRKNLPSRAGRAAARGRARRISPWSRTSSAWAGIPWAGGRTAFLLDVTGDHRVGGAIPPVGTTPILRPRPIPYQM